MSGPCLGSSSTVSRAGTEPCRRRSSSAGLLPRLGQLRREPEPGDAAERAEQERGEPERTAAPGHGHEPAHDHPYADEEPDDASVHETSIGHSRTWNERRAPRTGGRSSTPATTAPRSRPRYANTAMPALCGSSSRLRGRSVASRAAAAEEREPESVAGQPLGHVAAIDEAQLEQAKRSPAANAERARIEAPHDPAANAEVDDDADPKPHPYVLHAERPRRQEHERRVISGCGPPRRRRGDMESRLRAGREPEPQRAQAEPGRGAAGGPHPRFAPQRARESCARDVDEQGPAARVAHGDRGSGLTSQRQAQRACAEPDAPAGRGTRDGCRGRCEDERYERASHLPITVKVSVAV